MPKSDTASQLDDLGPTASASCAHGCSLCRSSAFFRTHGSYRIAAQVYQRKQHDSSSCMPCRHDRFAPGRSILEPCVDSQASVAHHISALAGGCSPVLAHYTRDGTSSHVPPPRVVPTAQSRRTCSGFQSIECVSSHPLQPWAGWRVRAITCTRDLLQSEALQKAVNTGFRARCHVPSAGHR